MVSSIPADQKMNAVFAEIKNAVYRMSQKDKLMTVDYFNVKVGSTKTTGIFETFWENMSLNKETAEDKDLYSVQ